MKCYFFGTFNPLHNAHLEIAKKIKEHFNFDEVIFIPAYAPVHKIPDTTPSDRLNMAQLGAGRKNVDDIEYFLPIPSYSYNTILELKKRDKTEKINFIMGYDSFIKIESWKNPQILRENVNFIVIPRHYENISNISFEHLRQKGWNFKIANIDFMDISSNMIRDKVQNGEKITNFVPKKVEEYIYEHGLYKRKAQRVPN